MPRRQFFLILSLLAVPAHSQLVPGLPIYSADGSETTSWTLPDFQPEFWTIPPPSEGMVVSESQFIPDADGNLWLAVESSDASDPPQSQVDLVWLGEDGVWNSHTVIPASASILRYGVVQGPEELWCAVEEETSEGLIRVYPCTDPASATTWSPPEDHPYWGWEWEAELAGWRLQFVEGEPVILAGELEDGLVVHWTRSDSIRSTCSFCSRWIGSSLNHVASSGSSLAALWSGHRKVAGSGGRSETVNYLTILRDGEWITSELTYSASGPGEDVEGLGERDHLFLYSSFLGMDFGDPSRVYLPYLEGATTIERGEDGRVTHFSISTRPRIRTYEIRTLDVLGDWELGYPVLKETVGRLLTHGAVAGNQDRVAFLFSREGQLDLWILQGDSWYGPYPISDNRRREVSPDIAVDRHGRYWVTWSEGESLHASVISPDDLHLGSIPTSVETGSALPATASMEQNVPNPFNAHTLIEARVPPGGSVSLDIFNLRAQRVRTFSVAPGPHHVLWDGTDDSGRPVASGVYLYRLREGPRTLSVRRMALVR